MVRLRRHRDESETALLRTSVEESEQTRHLQRLEGRIDAIGAAIQTEQLEILRFVLQSPNPSEKSAREQIWQWIEALPRPIRCAKRPHVS